MKKPKSTPKPILTAEQLEAADVVAAYAHPESARTVARHHDGEAYTITGLHAGKANPAAAAKAAKAIADAKTAADKAAVDKAAAKAADQSKPPMPPKAK